MNCVNFSARPPGSSQHVLPVLVFWSWVLLLPRLPPSSQSLRSCPWTSIFLYGPLEQCLDLLPAALPPPVQKTGRTAHVFTAQGGTRRQLQYVDLLGCTPRGWLVLEEEF